MDSLDARVISKFPLSPSSAGTRMKTSVTFWKTSQCYKMNRVQEFQYLKGLALKLNRVGSGDRRGKQDPQEQAREAPYSPQEV